VSGKVIIKYHLGAEDGDEENSGNSGSSFGFARGHLIPDLNSKTLPEYSSEHYTFSKSHSLLKILLRSPLTLPKQEMLPKKRTLQSRTYPAGGRELLPSKIQGFKTSTFSFLMAPL
jgi:hypothetical protein